MSLIVSVVIPTFDRPDLLDRAILSCLSGAHSDNTEVIVVPNGSSASWRKVQMRYAQDPRVLFYHSPLADQNNARNIGIELARGELIRFLDDDDFLFPNEADRQYDLMLHSDLDFTSADVILTDESNAILGGLAQPDTDSPEIAGLSKERLQLPFAHVYRRSSIGNLRWPAGMEQSEDIVWLIRYVATAPRRWKRVDVSVGAWYQHSGCRQSLDRPSGVVHEATAQVLLEACSSMQKQGRWNAELALVVAEALWSLVHRAFPFRPIYWSNIARQAEGLGGKARPDAPVYGYPVFRSVSPLILMWLLLPKRWMSLAFIFIRGSVFGRDYKRTL